MFFICCFIIVWSAWILLADKSRWREIVPVSIAAVSLSAMTDTMFTRYYVLWEFHDEDIGPAARYLADDIGIYPVVTYLFIQWLPKNKTLIRLLGYWVLWTSISIAIEYIYIRTGHLDYHQWWNIGWSYATDWLLFYIFYKFHSTFRLWRLN